MSLKEEFIRLLREDETFRYAVSGFLGLEEILKRLDRNEQELVRLHEGMMKGFERHDEEIARLREDVATGFQRHDEQIARLREDMIEGFRKHDEEIATLRKDMVTGFQRHDEQIARLREDMTQGFELMNRHIDALGARWGLMTEEAFRESLRGLLGREFGLEAERWVYSDMEGYVFGFPRMIEVDVALHDKKAILIEVSSHVRASDVLVFRRKAEFYEKVTGRKPSRLLIVTPYAEDNAKEASSIMGVEIYARV